MSDEQRPRLFMVTVEYCVPVLATSLFMVTVEFCVPVLATSREAAEEHAQEDYDVWSDERGLNAHAHAREITSASQLDDDTRHALPYLADVEDSEERTCAEWVTP